MWRLYLFCAALGAASFIIVDHVKERALKRRRKLLRRQRRYRSGGRPKFFHRPLTFLTHGYVNLLFLSYTSILEQFFRHVDRELEDSFSPETRVLMGYFPRIKYTCQKAWLVGSGINSPRPQCIRYVNLCENV